MDGKPSTCNPTASSKIWTLLAKTFDLLLWIFNLQTLFISCWTNIGQTIHSDILLKHSLIKHLIKGMHKKSPNDHIFNNMFGHMRVLKKYCLPFDTWAELGTFFVNPACCRSWNTTWNSSNRIPVTTPAWGESEPKFWGINTSYKYYELRWAWVMFSIIDGLWIKQ